jgi:ribosomal protein S18 acetylase RimI-like enzyme
MEVTARLLDPEEWHGAADVAARSLQETFAAVLGHDPVERLAALYGRYRGLSTDHALAIGAFVGPYLMGMARAAAPGHCLCVDPPDIPAATAEEVRASIRAHVAFIREHHPEEPHWWVGPVGVEPGMQRRGIGTAAMRTLLGELTTRVGPVRLEAEDVNVGFYERLRFERIERAVASDDLALTFMQLRHDQFS